MRNNVTDTAKQAKESPITTLVTMMMSGDGGAGIYAQEAQGQRELVQSDLIPKDGADKDVLEQLGFTFPDEDTGDALFIYAILPKGWSKAGTGHSMHSNILDEQGRERIGVFYKAAYYDRSAHMYLLIRYQFGQDYSDANYTDGKRIDNRSFVTDRPTKERLFAGTDEECEAWLKENKPDYRNPLAYWDD